MPILNNPEREMLERIAAEGKTTRLRDEEVASAKELETAGLLFLVGTYAVITPKGRRLLAELDQKPKKPPKPPLGFLE
jgi:hypothetical protein